MRFFLKDNFGREINYLRLSLTERCRLKCTYCSASHGEGCVKDREMKTDDAVFIAQVCSELGFDKIRLTGGEPLLRRDLAEIVSGISATEKYSDIALTTNGQLLSEQAQTLKDAGLMRCNISIDSFNSETYKKITGGELAPVIDGIKKAYEIFGEVRLNAVLIKGINDNEAEKFFETAKNYPVDIRFIELMPLGDSGEKGVPTQELLNMHKELKAVENSDKNAPAVYYSAPGWKGRIGFISPISCAFCESCNRLRITSDLKIRPCLGSNLEYDISDAVKKKDKAALTVQIKEAILSKPERSGFNGDFYAERKMNAIGG